MIKVKDSVKSARNIFLKDAPIGCVFVLSNNEDITQTSYFKIGDCHLCNCISIIDLMAVKLNPNTLVDILYMARIWPQEVYFSIEGNKNNTWPIKLK